MEKGRDFTPELETPKKPAGHDIVMPLSWSGPSLPYHYVLEKPHLLHYFHII